MILTVVPGQALFVVTRFGLISGRFQEALLLAASEIIRTTAHDPLVIALGAIETEVVNAFDWLAAGIDRGVSVTFVPNPGNIGDAAINLACFEYLTERFDRVEICAITDTPRTECVFLGGGGNAVEPLYYDVRNFLDGLATHHRLFIFPATIRGYSESLRRVAPFTRILCRELNSLAYVAKQIGPQNVSLTHDAAFLLSSCLRKHFATRVERLTTAKCTSLRRDIESTHPELGGNDIMSMVYRCLDQYGART